MNETSSQRTADRAVPEREGAPSTLALVLVTGIGPFGTDTYLAALPELRTALHTSATLSQLTITSCIVGLAIGMLLGGTISDGIGRRVPLLLVAGAFLVTSIGAAVAPNIGVLLACRLLQGLASGAGASIGRAVVSDRYRGLAAAKRFGTLGAIGLVSPVIAPAVGGAIIAVAGWRGVFWFMAVLGAAQLVAVAVGVPETLRRRGHDHEMSGFLHRVATLVRIRRFGAAVVIASLSTAGFFVYIGGSSFVLRDHYGLSADAYSLVFAVNAIGMALASVAFRVTVSRAGSVRLRTLGLCISSVATLVLVAAAVATRGDPPFALVWIGLFAVVAGMGLSMPASTVLAQQAGEQAPGTASSLQSGTAFLVGAAATPLSSVIDDASVTVMVGLMAAFFVVTMAFFFGTRSNIAARVDPGSVAR